MSLMLNETGTQYQNYSWDHIACGWYCLEVHPSNLTLSSLNYVSKLAVQLMPAVQMEYRHNITSSSLPVKGVDGEWSVGTVLKRDTLSNNTVVYQNMLREGRRKGSLDLVSVAGRRKAVESEQIQGLQEQVSMIFK